MDPQAIAGIYSSDIVSNFDIHKPDILDQIFRTYGDQGFPDFFLMINSLGWMKPAALDTYGNYEENRFHVGFETAGATGAGTGNNTVDITLGANSVDSNNRYYPRENQLVLFPDANGTVGKIVSIDDQTTPSAPVLTIRPQVAGENIPAVGAGDKLIIFSNVWTEGSGQPRAALSGVTYYDNDAQIIKETIGMTGSEMVNQTWVRINGMANAPYYYKGQAEIDYRMALQIDGACLFGKRTTNPAAVDADGFPDKTTEGLVPYMKRRANQVIIAPGSFDPTDLNAIDKVMDRNHAGAYVLSMMGIDRHHEVEDSLVDYFKDTNIAYAQKVVNEELFGGSESLGATVNFKYLTKAQRTFMFKRFKSFNHPELYGATGYPYSNYMMFIPMNKRRDAKNKNQLVESIGMRYRALGPYNRKSEVWQVGGAGNGLKVNQFDKTNTYQRAHVGAHFRGGEQMVLVTEAAS